MHLAEKWPFRSDVRRFDPYPLVFLTTLRLMPQAKS